MEAGSQSRPKVNDCPISYIAAFENDFSRLWAGYEKRSRTPSSYNTQFQVYDVYLNDVI